LASKFFERFLLKESAEPKFGSGSGTGKSQAILFVGVLAGALSKILYDYFYTETAQSVGATVSVGTVVIACIASIVIFPKLYYVGGLDQRKLSFAHWTLAFQNGFFWNVAFAEIASRMNAS
jgi:peptidoglycan biosynthesis protein MviN/MurJ (putative lipid II flippase)